MSTPFIPLQFRFLINEHYLSHFTATEDVCQTTITRNGIVFIEVQSVHHSPFTIKIRQIAYFIFRN